MATRPARLLTGYGGNLLTGYGGVLLIGPGYPEVDVPDTGDEWVATRPRPRPRPDDLDEIADALLAALLLTV